MDTEKIEEILTYWFEGRDHNFWFGKNDKVDAEIEERFGELVLQAQNGDLDDWADDKRGRLALILLLDQFARNVFRDDPRAYDGDMRAQRITLEAIEMGEDRDMEKNERHFLYMPLMHAEDKEMQQASVDVFEKLYGKSDASSYAEKHKVIIDRFGRFPHRNKVLGRESTPEEEEFLKEPDSSF